MSAHTQTPVPGKVFIGGLSQNTDDDVLRSALASYVRCAPVDCHVMIDGKTGRSRGFGFAVFASPASARTVVQMQPIIVDGREVTVSDCWEKGATPMPRTDPVAVVAPASSNSNREQLKIFVGGLAQHTTKESLDEYFAQFGQADSYIMMDKASGRSRGFGFVNFQEELALAGALQVNHEIDGVPVTVSLYEPAASAAGARSTGAGQQGSQELLGVVTEVTGHQQSFLELPGVVPPQLPVAAVQLAPPAASAVPAPAPVPAVAARDQLKIFVGGLSQHTTKQSLDEYFSQFGYADSFVMTDRATGRSRGFGFVNFGDRQVMEGVLQLTHEVDGVCITTSPYAGNFNPNRGSGGSGQVGLGAAPAAGLSLADVTAAGPMHVADIPSFATATLLSQVEEKLQGAVLNAVATQQQPQLQLQSQSNQQHAVSQANQLKIFVGGLAQHTTKESLDTYFSQFGHANSYVMMDKASGRSRGFGFVNFTDDTVMSTVLSFQHEVDGQIITVNKYDANPSRPRAGGGSTVCTASNGGAAPGATALGSTAVEILSNTIQMISKLRSQIESQAAQQAPEQPVQRTAVQQPALSQQTPSDLGLQSTSSGGSVKLFVGGLAPTTTVESLLEAFGPYGCTDAEVIVDKFTGRLRGFGFASFSSLENAEAAMQVQHVVEGRQVELSECWEKGAANPKRAGGAPRSVPY